ncbi:putative ubiquitin-protein ligase [Martiniozyma asiatica (nom. inval.)]|nr:putative ubiquitin-protein ligase [Martiniozyma asiatica]
MELADFRKFLLEHPKKFEFKYTHQARESLKQRLNTIVHIDLNDLIIDETNHNHFKRPCGRQFERGETCFRCLTCGNDETCALCIYCFEEEMHVGHEIHKSIIQSKNVGICDCGDQEAFSQLKCKHYTTPAFDSVKTIRDENFFNHLTLTLGVILDYVLDVMTHSVALLSSPQRKDQILENVKCSQLLAEKYHLEDLPSGKYGLVLYSDQVHQLRDAVHRISVVTGKVIEYAEMIARRCSSHGRAVVMVSENIDLLIKKHEPLCSTGLTACIRDMKDIFREEMCDDIIDWFLNFTSTNILKNDNSVRSLVAKVMCMPYNMGCQSPDGRLLCNKTFVLNPKSLRRYGVPSFNHSTPLVNTMGKWGFSNTIKDECRYYDDEKLIDDDFIGSRFQFFLFFDIRFCKVPRGQLHSIYTPVMDQDLKFNDVMAAQFMDIYEDILALFLIMDREPEFSVMPILSVQVFTSPSNASLILQHGDILKMIRAMYNYVTTSHTENTQAPKNGVVFSTLKNRKWAHVLLDLNYVIINNSEIDNIFSFFLCFPEYVHFLSVFQSKPIFKRESKEHVEYENQDYTVFFNALTVISLFSESIGKVLNRIPKDRLLSQGNQMDVLYHSYTTKVKKSFTETLYTIIVRKIVELLFSEKICDDLNGKIITEKEDPIVFKQADGLGYENLSIVNFNTLHGKVSFLHPLHSMFAWLVEMDQSMDNSPAISHLLDMIQGEYEFFLKQQGGISGPGSILVGSNEGILAFFDIPLRKIVLISQIKNGLWVRNGVSVKTQMSLYRNGGGREFGFMRDLFLVQIFVSFCSDKNLAMKNILDRWGLSQWINGKFESDDYNKVELHLMVEEFVLFMIHLLSTDLHLHKLSASDVQDLLIEKEIVHSLCYLKLSYSKIASKVPEHVSSIRRFPVVFNQFVEEVVSKSSSKNCAKLYKLRKDLEETIDPYYIHFTSNQRDECISAVKERIHKKSGIKKVDAVIEPRIINWNGSPFEKITELCYNDVILCFVLQTLNYCIDIDDISLIKDEKDGEEGQKINHESLLDITLHFIHLLIMNAQWNDLFPNLFKKLIEFLEVPNSDSFKPKVLAIMKHFMTLFDNANFDVQSKFPEFNPAIINSFTNKQQGFNGDSDQVYERKKALALKKKKKC